MSVQSEVGSKSVPEGNNSVVTLSPQGLPQAPLVVNQANTGTAPDKDKPKAVEYNGEIWIKEYRTLAAAGFNDNK